MKPTWNSLYLRIRQHIPYSLRTQVALVIAALSFLPNLVLIFTSPLIFDTPINFSPNFLALLLWIPILAILSALIGYVISYQILKPLTQLAQEASTLDQVEQWSQLLRPQDPQESMVLRGAFAKLLHQIQIEQDRRSAVTATLMHDLKTPLIAFHQLLTVIKDNPLLPREQQVDILTQVLQENDRISSLVQKMVQVHRYEQGNFQLQMHLCHLSEMALSLVKRLTPLALERGIRLEVQGTGEALADSSELERALANVVENGLRYARQSVRIRVEGSCLEVSDDGPGLPAPLEQLAQPYTMQPVEIAGQRYTAGTGGLGLFIARRIMESHGGSLTLSHSGPDGTRLVLALPPGSGSGEGSRP